MGLHALLAPSGFKALMLCPAKPAMERGRPDQAKKDTDEGTAAHYLGAWCLQRGEQAHQYLGRLIVVWANPESEEDGACWGGDPLPDGAAERHTFDVDQDFAEAVQVYIDVVRDYTGDGTLFVEQAVPIGHITGENGATGTADAVILRGNEITVIDLKFGMGVEVFAKENPQLRLYALGALHKFDLVGDIDSVRTVICQPRLKEAPDEVTQTVAELQDWAESVAKPAAQQAMFIYEAESTFEMMRNTHPHEEACRFCRAKGACPALDNFAKQALGHEFTDLTTESEPEREAIAKAAVATAKAAGQLGAKFAAVSLVEIWIKGVRAETERELLAGVPVEGAKLVAGRRGARTWSDLVAAQQLLRKTFRLKVEQAFDLKLISPTSAEKLLKATPKRWAKAQALITQSSGKPSVAPASDPRPALEVKPIESEFTPITETPATADDLV